MVWMQFRFRLGIRGERRVTFTVLRHRYSSGTIMGRWVCDLSQLGTKEAAF